jgi:hypothetical protein
MIDDHSQRKDNRPMVTASFLLRKRLLIVLVAITTSGFASAQAPSGHKAAPGNQKQPAAQTKANENYRVVTEADGLSCTFSQDIATSMGIAALPVRTT